MRDIGECIVFCGPGLQPYHCSRFQVEGDTITRLDRRGPCETLEHGCPVVIPGMYNSHTHMGDSCLPDGATGLTLEAGFLRPHGYKYRQLALQSSESHLAHIANHLRYMARTGTIGHLDFREQGAYGSELLREAAHTTGIDSIILGQFDSVPFNDAELIANQRGLNEAHMAELREILHAADGFSESTMNDLTDAAWRQIRVETDRLGKLRAIHCLENEGYRDLSVERLGKGDLERALDEYQPHLIVHLTVANDNEIELLARSGIPGILNPRANANLGLPLPPIKKLLDAGVVLLLGTDNGMLNSPNMFAELDFTYKVAKSQYGNAVEPDPLVILRMATSHIHKLLGVDRFGYLEVGLPADYVVLDFNAPHLCASKNIAASVLTRVTPSDVIATYRQGRVLYQR